MWWERTRSETGLKNGRMWKKGPQTLKSPDGKPISLILALGVTLFALQGFPGFQRGQPGVSPGRLEGEGGKLEAYNMCPVSQREISADQISAGPQDTNL